MTEYSVKVIGQDKVGGITQQISAMNTVLKTVKTIGDKLATETGLNSKESFKKVMGANNEVNIVTGSEFETACKPSAGDQACNQGSRAGAKIFITLPGITGQSKFTPMQLLTHEFGHNFTGPLTYSLLTGSNSIATFNGNNQHVFDFAGGLGDFQRRNDAQSVAASVSGFGTKVGEGPNYVFNDSEITADAFANWIQGTVGNDYQDIVNSWMQGVIDYALSQ